MKIIMRLFRWLASPYLAIGLLIVMLIASIFGSLLYSQFFKSVINKDAQEVVFNSTWFLLLNILLLINTACCTWRQFNLAYRRNRLFSLGSRPNRVSSLGSRPNRLSTKQEQSLATASTVQEQTMLPDTVKAVLDRHGYKNYRSKNRLAVWMSPLFHLGLVILIAGAFMDHFTGFTGYLSVRPGIEVEASTERYLELEQKPLYREQGEPFNIRLEKIFMDYQEEGVASSAEISILRNGQTVINQVLDDHTPIWIGATAINKERHGYYVNYKIADSTGAVIDERAMGLVTLLPVKATKYIAEEIQPEGTQYKFNLEFFPDVQEQNGQYNTASYRLHNPAVVMQVYREGQLVFSGLVKQGESKQFVDGSNFTFNSVTPYLYLRVQSVTGTYIVVSGFILFLVGLILYYTIYPAIIRVEQVEGRCKVSVTAWAGRIALRQEAEEIEHELNQSQEG